MVPLDLTLTLLSTAIFLASWQIIRLHVAAHGPINQARIITKINSWFYSAASLAFILLLTFPSLDHQARHVFHLSKLYEYIDVLGVCATGREIDLHFGFHHLTTPYLTLVRVIWYSEGWRIGAALNTFHHVLMYAYFGGASFLGPALYVTGVVQLVVGLAGEARILSRRDGEGQVWPHVTGFGLMGAYLCLWTLSVLPKREQGVTEKKKT
ncbi:hypothetical protein ACJ41O_014783 [Fusarium nematophilum]